MLKGTRSVPRVVVAGKLKLRSYGAAHREIMRSVEHRSHKGLGNRAENSHRPTRRRERTMKGFPQHRRSPVDPVRLQRRLTASGPAATWWPPPNTAPR